MFTEQVQQLNALRGQLDDAVIDAFLAVFGQCANGLEQRGPVTIDVHPNRQEDAPCHEVSDGDLAASLTVKSYGSQVTYTRDENQVGEGRICGPAAIFADGLVYARPNDDNFSFIGKCADLECFYGDNADFHDLDVDDVTVNNELNAKVVRWAVAQSNWQHGGQYPSKGGGMAWVSVKECATSDGGGVTGAAFDVWLPVASARDPNIIAGNVLLIQKASDGDWVCEHGGDSAIGMVKYWSSKDENDLPEGWNGYPLEGNLFVAAKDETFDADALPPTGETHSHSTHTPGDAEGGTISDHDIGAYTELAYTGISLDNHDDPTSTDYTGVSLSDHPIHFHEFAETDTIEAGSSELITTGARPSPPSLDFAGETLSSHVLHDYGHYHYLDVYHYVNDPEHRHYFSTHLEHDWSLPHNEAENLPPSVKLRLIIRIDNSLGA